MSFELPYSDSTYRTLSLQARKKLIERILEQDKQAKRILQSTAGRLIAEIKRLEAAGQYGQLSELLDTFLLNNAIETKRELESLYARTITVGVAAGMYQSKEITLRMLRSVKMDTKPIVKSYFRVNERAVEAMERRTLNGLQLSDRIWHQSKRMNDTLGIIVRDGIHAGDHPVDVTKKLQRYVKDGANTLVIDYPNMMERIGDLLPNDLSYEALRLARTEVMASYGEGVKQSSELLPSSQGFKWSLSNAGVSCDVCKENAERDSGMGPGVYTKENLPRYPAHPNCMCQLTNELEDTDQFIGRLKEWLDNPMAHQDIEQWYQTIYASGR